MLGKKKDPALELLRKTVDFLLNVADFYFEDEVLFLSFDA